MMTMTDQLARANASHYARVNRKEWLEHGFGMSTLRMHADDRKLVLAYVDVVRQERLLSLIGQQDANIVEFAANRSVRRQPTQLSIDEIKEKAEDHPTKSIRAQIHSLLHSAKACQKEAEKANRQVLANPTQLKHEALYVTYNNLARAKVKYAEALLEYNSPDLWENAGEEG